MKVRIFRAELPGDAQLLSELDHKIFGQGDAFDPEDFELNSRCFFVSVDGNIVGSVMIEEHVTVGKDYDDCEKPDQGSFYIASIGFIPEWQGKGIGSIVLGRLIELARKEGFMKMVANMRKSNLRSIALHEKFGFNNVSVVPNYYEDPVEDSVVMELKLRAGA